MRKLKMNAIAHDLEIEAESILHYSGEAKVKLAGKKVQGMGGLSDPFTVKLNGRQAAALGSWFQELAIQLGYPNRRKR